MFLRRFIVLLTCLIATTSTALAGIAEAQTWFDALGKDTKFLIQADLVLLGLYDRYIDGDYGAGTYRAIGAYEARLGQVPDGVLSPSEIETLNNEASEVYGQLGFAAVTDDSAGITLFAPLKLLEKKSPTKRGTTYSSADGDIVLETAAKPLSEQSFPALFAQLGTTTAKRTVTYSTYNDSAFTVSGEYSGRRYYSRFYASDGASIGFTLSWTDRYSSVGKMVSIMLANLSTPSSQGNVRPLPETNPSENRAPQIASGSGFIISSQGLIATNFHVAGKCSTLTVPGFGHATLVRGDEKIDLAVIQLDSQVATHWATIRSTPPELAENVVLLGYPLAEILDSSLNVATGIVSAETGLAGNKDWFTTNAGIQPGNSGGPILDLDGHIVGVAVAKIDDAKLLAAMGDTAPNVGFGINNSTLLKFVSIFQHAETADLPSQHLNAKDIAKIAKEFTVQIICEQAG